jgi:hypothetical protein
MATNPQVCRAGLEGTARYAWNRAAPRARLRDEVLGQWFVNDQIAPVAASLGGAYSVGDDADVLAANFAADGTAKRNQYDGSWT